MTPAPGSQAEGIDRDQNPNDVVMPWAQVSFAAPDRWVEEETYDDKIATKEGAHITYLLLTRQTDADAGKSFYATAIRLETALSVQNESQWRLSLDPRFQKLTLHWLRIVRNNERIDHLRRDHMRLIQRETQLEHHVINGSWTLLAVLDDVRPGDIIESGYSYEFQHPIITGLSETFFAVPEQFVVGRYRLSVLFDSTRPSMNWKASADAPNRQEKALENGRKKWSWEGSQTILFDPEFNCPSSYLRYIWIQVSDFTGWNPLATRVADAWIGVNDVPDFDLLPEFKQPQNPNAAAVTGLVRYIQDQFRYLSIDLATGGWVPASPAVVVRQRHGDCKDLVWLACTVLRRWGVKTRPILVGTGMRERVCSLLPMTVLFNHVVLEVEVDGMTRWFDLTLRSQGGDFTSQPIGLFGYGMPVDASADALQAQPPLQGVNLYALRETISLDTRRGEPSTVEQRLWAEGFQAENLRRTRLAQGADGFAIERLKHAQKRFGKAARIGALEWRDDRDRNVCELVEVFQISNVINAGEGGERANYDVPPNIVVQTFAIPEDKPRRSPWSMPFPFEIRHSITVRSKDMGMLNDRRRKWTTKEFTATLDEPRLSGKWTKTARFIVDASEIPADRLGAYRQQITDFFRATSWRLYLAWGKSRFEVESGSGKLPSPALGVNAYVSSDDLNQYPKATIGTDDPIPGKFKVVKNRWRRFRNSNTRWQYIIAIWFLLAALSSILHSCSSN
jgi:transglutaminase-like putative cysteine protease